MELQWKRVIDTYIRVAIEKNTGTLVGAIHFGWYESVAGYIALWINGNGQIEGQAHRLLRDARKCILMKAQTVHTKGMNPILERLHGVSTVRDSRALEEMFPLPNHWDRCFGCGRLINLDEPDEDIIFDESFPGCAHHRCYDGDESEGIW